MSSSASEQSTKRKPDDVKEESVVKKPRAENEKAPVRVFRGGDAGDIVCPYLDTINRKLLDFDFEKVCSVSLANMNVYACLVCGKYFQGRGKSSHAYFHALETDHHVFINLDTEKMYCLPDGYQVKDSSLEDIVFNLHPRFSPQDLSKLDRMQHYSHALDGTDYLPGAVGLNNIKNTDWLNVCVQALIRIPPIRNFFLIKQNYAQNKSLLVQRFGELLCKMWNFRAFKGHVSPHELLQAISSASNKRFRIGEQADPLVFLSWFLNTLHKDLGGTKKKNSSVIYQAFQGEVNVDSEQPVKPNNGDADQDDDGKDDGKEDEKDDDVKTEHVTATVPFLYLSLDLPPAPLFKDGTDNIIPQIPLFDLLAKFDGLTTDTTPQGYKKRYQLRRLPRYLILHIKRFTKNNWFVEKNPTLVNFPIKNLDMKGYLEESKVPTIDELQALPVAELKKQASRRKVDVSGAVEKDDIVAALAQSYEQEVTVASKYDLIANICHEGKPDKGAYKAHIFHRPTDTWYEMQDLRVWTTETMPQLVALSEAYVQVYELKKN